MSRRAAWALVCAARTPVLRAPVLVPTVAAAVATVGCYPLMDGPEGLQVLRAVGVLLACALLAAVDDPTGEVLAASPYPRAVRVGSRLAVGAALVVPLWLLAAGMLRWRQPEFPVGHVALEAVALGLAGVAIALGLRVWRDLHRPSQPATLGLLAVVAASESLGRWYALGADQAWGPPWAAAHLRWVAVAMVGAAVAIAALRDPLDR